MQVDLIHYMVSGREVSQESGGTLSEARLGAPILEFTREPGRGRLYQPPTACYNLPLPTTLWYSRGPRVQSSLIEYYSYCLPHP